MLPGMTPLTRRSCLAMGGMGLLPSLIGPGRSLFAADPAATRRTLPMATLFKGTDRFESLLGKAREEDWGRLPIGERMVRFGRELEGLPYVNFTLEIDDHIESPSANLDAFDCWTFFEQCLGLARLIGFKKDVYEPVDLLRQIELTRYRGGLCSGNYLERIHYLAEWFFENDARGTCRHLTPRLPGAERIRDRKVTEMTTLWKSYRYLRNNPDLRPPMRELEITVERLPVWHVPKAKVAAIEGSLQNGDVIGIATKYNGGFCSHVGLVSRGEDGVARFLHASRNHKKITVDKSVSGYLADFSSHAGILVGRPLEVTETVTDPAIYKANLEKLTLAP